MLYAAEIRRSSKKKSHFYFFSNYVDNKLNVGS